jgi:hypothetical protein
MLSTFSGADKQHTTVPLRICPADSCSFPVKTMKSFSRLLPGQKTPMMRDQLFAGGVRPYRISNNVQAWPRNLLTPFLTPDENGFNERIVCSRKLATASGTEERETKIVAQAGFRAERGTS